MASTAGARADLSRFFDLVLDVADPWRLERARDLAGWSGGDDLVAGLCIVAGVARADVVDGDVSFPVTLALNGVAPAGWDDEFDLARVLGTCPCDDDVAWCVHTIALALEVIRTAEDAPGLLGVWRQDPASPPTWGVLPGGEPADVPGTSGADGGPAADPADSAGPAAPADPWDAALKVRDQPDRPLGAWIADAFADVNASDWPRLHKTLMFCLHPDRRHGDDRWSRVLQETWTRLSM